MLWNLRFSSAAWMLLALALAKAQGTPAEDELGKRATWDVPTPSQVKGEINHWLDQFDVDEIVRFQVDTLWSEESFSLTNSQMLERLALTIAVVDPSTKSLVDCCSGARTAPSSPDFDFLEDSQTPAFVRDNLRLFYGRWLAQHDLYDEALRHLEGLQTADVVDPASLLFYQGICYHRLLKKDQCLPVLERLLERSEEIPQRFASVAELMVADIQPLRQDSLDEISRIMKDIRRRQQLYRSGTRVRQQEKDVLTKLDKLIEELEEQKRQQQSGGSSSQGMQRSAQPMQDSMPGGGMGEGNVDPKEVGEGSDWGDLPPKERQAALQDLSKDLPAHYREIIEEYFKKIAKDEPR